MPLQAGDYYMDRDGDVFLVLDSVIKGDDMLMRIQWRGGFNELCTIMIAGTCIERPATQIEIMIEKLNGNM